MADNMERWLHHEGRPMPSYQDLIEWSYDRREEMLMAIATASEPQIRASLDRLYRGLMLFDAAKHSDSSMAEVIWRLDISMDGSATWEEVCDWSEHDYTINAERIAKARAAAARLDGHEARVVKLTRHFVEQSEEVPS